MMPEMDGFAFAKALREQDKNIPILFMTARDDFSSKERGYRLGIDDYMVKPIHLDELVLHIEALLRRAHIAAEKKLVIGNLVLDEDEISAAVDGVPVFLTLREFQILFKLLSYPKRTFTRSQLLEDFSVRLSSMRKDGKKDEFEVLFEDFNTMAEELSSTEMMKSDFIANVSHELTPPLAVIQNYATLLQSEYLPDEERRLYPKRISEASRHLSALVTNILQVNRLENQKIKPALHPFNLSEALCRCILNYESELDEKEIELYTDLDQDLSLTSDENLLDMVWNNLLSNAVKFTPPRGKIRVMMQQEGDSATVKITDSGCGIDGKSIRRIFDKFYQADPSHATQGNGIGLTLTKRIIDLLEGEILAESMPGVSSAFTVKLHAKGARFTNRPVTERKDYQKSKRFPGTL